MDDIKVESTHEHINSLEDCTPSQSVLHFVKGMGLEYWITNGDSPAMSYRIKHPYDLIDVVIKAYNVEQRAFILPNGTRLVYSLDDVFRLTGLPPIGKPVVGDEKGGKKKFLVEFGSAPGASTAMKKSHGEKIKTSWLKETFMNHGHNYNSSTVPQAAAPAAADLANHLIPLDVKQHVKAYMLYFIHCFIIPDANRSAVPALYLQFLEDINKIQTYAWGAASLASLHHALENIKTTPSRTVGGPIYPLLLFFFEHIPNLVQIPRDNLPTKFPLMVEWTHLLYDKVGKKQTEESLKFSSIFKNAGEQEVTWMPYKRLKNDFVPPRAETLEEEDTNDHNQHVLDDIGGYSGIGGDYPFGGKQWRF